MENEMIQDDFNKFHASILKLMFDADEETREKCKPRLFELLVSYNRLCDAIGIERVHDMSKHLNVEEK
jgi:hypothetical protein